MANPAYHEPEYQRERARILAGRPPCSYCAAPATEADHLPPLSRHQHTGLLSGCCRLVPSCSACREAQADRMRRGLSWHDPGVVMVALPEPVGIPAADARWSVPWLEPFHDPPDHATWPRLMTLPHPDAVDSLGDAVAVWAHQRSGRPLRWWQRLALVRLLEVDALGQLVWDEALLSTARQVGKSWLLREGCLWRAHQAERFGEEQTVVHTGKDVSICREVQRPARAWAKAQRDVYKVREVNGQEEIEVLADGSRWMLRAKEAVYGLSACLAVVDEAWAVRSASVDEGLAPTMVEREQAQTWLVSTAHRRATSLMLNRRTAALGALDEPGKAALMIEWSTPRGADMNDRAAWRQASPEWSPKREKLIAARLYAALHGEVEDADEPDPLEAFRAQWLNQWPERRTIVGKGDELLPLGAWDDLLDESTAPTGALVFAVEDNEGRGVAAAAAGRTDDGRVVVGGWLFDFRPDAFDWVRQFADQYPGSRLVVGAALKTDAAVEELPVSAVDVATAGRTRAGLAALRALTELGGLVQDGSADLGEQVLAARVVNGAAGLSLVPGPRSDLLRAACWALEAAREPPPEPHVHH